MTRDPIRDEHVRDELDGLGLKHFLDVRATVRAVLSGLHDPQRAAFAAAVADRLLCGYERLPAAQQTGYVRHWRPVLDAVWNGLADPAARRVPQVAEAVGCFYLSREFHGRRHDDPTDVQDHATMAAFYAAQCFVLGGVEFASWAGWRGFDVAAVRAAEDREWPHRRPPELTSPAWELAHPAIQAELDRQLNDLELVSSYGPDPDRRSWLIGQLRGHAAAR